MIGAIIGDIVGSRFEWHNNKSKDFEFFNHDRCSFTDDSILTIAISDAIRMRLSQYSWASERSKSDKVDLEFAEKLVDGSGRIKDIVVLKFKEYRSKYPAAVGGYGCGFENWAKSESTEPYNSFGNGAAMRISSVAYASATEDVVKKLSRAVTEVTHNHPEGIKGAEATALAIFLALHGSTKAWIKSRMRKYYTFDFTVEELQKTYTFQGSCQNTVPQALQCFFESTSFVDAIRNAISIGGDSDTIGAITGAVAGAYYGVPTHIRNKAIPFLDSFLLEKLKAFERMFPSEKYSVDLVLPQD